MQKQTPKLKKILSKKGHRILKKAENSGLRLSSYRRGNRSPEKLCHCSDILMEKGLALNPKECCHTKPSPSLTIPQLHGTSSWGSSRVHQPTVEAPKVWLPDPQPLTGDS